MRHYSSATLWRYTNLSWLIDWLIDWFIDQRQLLASGRRSSLTIYIIIIIIIKKQYNQLGLSRGYKYDTTAIRTSYTSLL